MSRVEEVVRAHQNTERIRNICVIAHVDHGKTTLSDSLIASNGIISQNLAGDIRYLDNRKDEQERLITMKSSNISLLFRTAKDEEPYLVNLIDSPGHVDFSGEVSSAVRLSDGAIVVVDAVEGVCNQTHTVLRQAWDDKVKPCLVINKIDRLINELQLDPEEAYLQLSKTLESVNVIMATLFAEEMLRSKGERDSVSHITEEELDDSEVFFSPERGNVVFACAKYGWGFRIQHFAEMYAKRLNMNKDVLKKTLWGEYYFNAKEKKIRSNSGGGKYPRMFVQFILKNIWHVYKVVLEERSKEGTEKVLKVLGLKPPAREMRVFDEGKKGNPQTLLTSICRQWLPLSSVIIRMCIEQLPSPKEAQNNRIPKLYSPLLTSSSTEEIIRENELIEASLKECRKGSEDPVVLFISKVFASPVGSGSDTIDSGPRISVPQAKASDTEETESSPPQQTENVPTERFVGFGRIFSGTLRKGQTVYVLGPKYNPHQPSKHLTELTVNELYVMMGRGLEPIDEIPAGNVFGLGGIDDHVLKTATISSTRSCFPMLSVQFSQPIVRVAVEPSNPTEMPQLIEGLKKLNQSDASVEIYVQESGEHVINAAGEMHLERCLRDLKDMFAPIELEISPPIVSFKETIIKQGEPVFCRTRGKVCTMKIVAKPLPIPIVDFLEKNKNSISSIFRSNQGDIKKSSQFAAFQGKLLDVFVNAGWTKEFEKIWSFGPKRCGPNILFNASEYSETEFWKSICVSAEAVKLSRFQDEADSIVAAEVNNEEIEISLSDDDHWKLSLLQSLDFSITNGFQLATAGGPLCEEPLSGVAFFIEEIRIQRVPDDELNKYGPFKGQILPAICQGLRDAFNSGSPHLVEPYYSCVLQVPTRWFGDATSVLLKRRSKISQEQFLEGTDISMISASVPVVESFGFAPEIMRKTSGSARTQLQFSHWALLDVDPNWKPTTEDEQEEYGTNADAKGDNIARELVDDIRKRKGLHVEEKLIEHGEKQRTLSKKK